MEANNDLAVQPIPKLNEEDVKAHFNLLKSRSPNDFVELRALGVKTCNTWKFKKNATGYFSDIYALLKVVRENSGKRPLYLGLSPRSAGLLHSLPINSLVDNAEGGKDKDVECRNIVFIDIDTKKEVKNTAASDEELMNAIAVRDEIASYLESKGCSLAKGVSGNGGLIYLFIKPMPAGSKVDSKKDPQALFLRWLNRQYETELIEVDESTFNPSRIAKLCGTPSMKGANTKKRPWRASSIEVPEDIIEIDFEKVFKEEIKDQLRLESTKVKDQSGRPSSESKNKKEVLSKFSGDLRTLDIYALSKEKGLEPKEINENQFSILCPWREEHTTGLDGDHSTSIFLNEPDSFPGFHCFHNSHGKKTILDFLEWCGAKSVDSFCGKKYNKKRRKMYKDFVPFFDYALKGAKKDVFSGDLMIYREDQWQPVVSILPILISQAIDWKLPKSDVVNHLERYAEDFSPELLVEIPAWDGVDRIQMIGDCLTINNVSRQSFVSLVKDWGVKMLTRVFNPSVQNRMIILKGGQGLGKDELVKAMLNGLGQFFSECPISSVSKDTTIAQSELLVIHISEFDKTLKEGPGYLKAMITQESTYIRKPYARAAKLLKSRSSFISTVNIDDILRDPTGARRFLVFDLEGIKWEYPREDSVQIIAQFNSLREQGYRSSKESELEMSTYIKSKLPIDPTKNILELWDELLFDLSRGGSIKKLRLKDIKSEIAELARTMGVKFNKLLEIANRNDRSGRDSSGRYYFSLKKFDESKQISREESNLLYLEGDELITSM